MHSNASHRQNEITCWRERQFSHVKFWEHSIRLRVRILTWKQIVTGIVRLQINLRSKLKIAIAIGKWNKESTIHDSETTSTNDMFFDIKCWWKYFTIRVGLYQPHSMNIILISLITMGETASSTLYRRHVTRAIPYFSVAKCRLVERNLKDVHNLLLKKKEWRRSRTKR